MMDEYISLFSQVFNPLSIIWGGIKIALISFFVSLILLIVFKKIVLVKRNATILKYMARSYYFFVPVICLCFGFIYGIATTSRDQIIEKLPFYQSSIQSLITHNFDVNIEIATYADKSVNQMIDEAATEVQSKIVTQLKFTDNAKNQSQQFIVRVIESPIGISYIKSSLKDKIVSTTGFDKQLANDVFEVKLSQLLTGDIVIKVFSFYIKEMVRGFLMPIMIIWAILLFLPLIEIILSYSCHRRAQKLTEQRNI